MTEQQQSPMAGGINLIVGVLALALCVALGYAAALRIHNLELEFDNDQRTIACAVGLDEPRPGTLPLMRGQLGCYRNATGNSRAKQALAFALGKSCEDLAALRVGSPLDLDGTGAHPLNVAEVKEVYALAREVKDAGIKCSDIPRDPDDYSREITIAIIGFVFIAVLVALFRWIDTRVPSGTRATKRR